MSEQASELGDSPESAAQEPARVAQLGLLLRKAREARGLTIADVVAALKYSPRQIEALEADQMLLLPGNVFVRGIVRSYARMLKLDPAPLLALLEVEAPVVPLDVKAPDDMGVAMPRDQARQISVLVAVLVLGAIAAAAAGVWHFLTPQQRPVPATAEQAVVELPAPGPSSLPAGTDRTDASAVTTDQISLPQLAQPASAPAPMVTPTSPVVAKPAGSGKQLVFDFRGASWVEVKDSSERVIFTGQYIGGNHEVAMGQPPFQIVIGNAPLVDLKYEGHSVDLKPHIRADVARLTIE